MVELVIARLSAPMGLAVVATAIATWCGDWNAPFSMSDHLQLGAPVAVLEEHGHRAIDWRTGVPLVCFASSQKPTGLADWSYGYDDRSWANADMVDRGPTQRSKQSLFLVYRQGETRVFGSKQRAAEFRYQIQGVVRTVELRRVRPGSSRITVTLQDPLWASAGA